MSGSLQLSLPVSCDRIPKSIFSHAAKVELIRKVKNMHILKDHVTYYRDICVILSKTTPNLGYNTGTGSIFFVLDQLSNSTLHLLDRYVRHVYIKNKAAFEKSSVKSLNSSFMQLFNTISTELQSETAPVRRPVNTLARFK